MPERLAVACFIPMITLVSAGFVAGGYVPPPSPSATAREAADFLRDDVELRRLGMLLMAIGGSLWVVFGAAVAAQLRKIRGIGPTMAGLFLFG